MRELNDLGTYEELPFDHCERQTLSPPTRWLPGAPKFGHFGHEIRLFAVTRMVADLFGIPLTASQVASLVAVRCDETAI